MLNINTIYYFMYWVLIDKTYRNLMVVKLEWKSKCRVHRDFVCTWVDVNPIFKQEIRNCDRDKKKERIWN